MTTETDSQRRTAPQSPYTSREVAIGFGIFLLGVLVVFGVPLLSAVAN